MSVPAQRKRPAEFGIHIGPFPNGPNDAITDVSSVRVGHHTIWQDEPCVARTGVTAIVPAALDSQFARPMAAGIAVLNGAGELTGSLAIREWGLLETPILLTCTMGVGGAYHGAIEAMVAASPRVGVDDVVIPVVGECDDSWLHDAREYPSLPPSLARSAIDAATGGPIASGSIGAGTGMVCFGCKGGIGTASRVTRHGTVGVLVLANFGSLDRLTVDGEVVGPRLVSEGYGRGDRPEPAGSCIVVVATDAPLNAKQCERVARRAGLGLARVGSVAHNGSGEIFVAFSTRHRVDRSDRSAASAQVQLNDSALDDLFAATVDATETAVLDALYSAETVTGREGRTIYALPVDRIHI